MAIGFCRAVAALALAACCHTGQAQTAEETARSINAVKRDTTYLYAEATMKDLNEAYQAAKAILEMKVSDWVRAQHPGENIELCIVKAKEHFIQIETRRGELYRAFVYVRKGDVMPVTDKREVTVFEVTPVTPPNRAAATPAIIISEDAPADVEAASPSIELTSDEKQMLQLRKFQDVEPYIKEQRGKGKLKGYGKYADMPDTEYCHIFVFDKQGNIPAVLRKTGAVQYNLITLKEDNATNYNGAMWLQLK